MALLEIKLLGNLELSSQGVRCALPATLKAQSLLAYLIMHRARPVFREPLAECFWPERPAGYGLHSLSTALWQIRRVLPAPDFLLADAQTVQFNPRSDFWLDVEAFRQCLRPSHTEEPAEAEIARLQQATALYRGDFLEHFYDDWCLDERYALESLYLEALRRLLTLTQRMGRLETALELAQALLARDALREEVQSEAIQLLVRLDRRSEAIRLAQRYRARLWAELGLTPSPETVRRWRAWLGPDWERAAPEASLPSPLRAGTSGLPLLERPPFVGRDAAWAQLVEQWRTACAGRGHFILLNGEAGIGKTRLCEELTAYVQQHGGHTAVAQCYEQERILPYGPLTDLLRALIAAEPLPSVERLSRWQIGELSRLLPELDEAAGYARSFGRSTPSATPDTQQQARLLDAVNIFLLNVAQRRPLLLVLEDLHWASESTLAWLHSLARRLKTIPLLLLGSCRCENVTPTHPLQGLFASLERAGLASRLDLERLSLEALSGWFASAPLPLMTQLHHYTEGNPFFAVETLRALYAAGLIQIVSDRCLAPHAVEIHLIPASVQELICSRVAPLAPQAREVAELAAVMGSAFDFETLLRAWGHDEDALLEAIEALLRQRLIRERAISGADYEFDHHLIQEWLYTQLHYRRRQRWHRAIGRALEAHAATPTQAARIAYHLDAATDYRSALPYYGRAIQAAQAQLAWQEAERYFERWLKLVDLLDPAKSDPDLQRQRAEMLSLRAEQHFNLGHLAECEADVAALELSAPSGDPRIQLLALIERIRLLNFSGHYEKALRLIEPGLAHAHSLADVEGEYRLLLYAAAAHYFLGHPQLALQALEQGRRLHASGTAACERKRARLYQYLGYVHFHLGQWKHALEDQKAALAHSLALEDASCAVWNQLDTAYMHLRLGQLAEAQQRLEAGLALAEQLQSPAAQGYALMLRGEIALHAGDDAAAESTLRLALPLLKAAHSEHNIIAAQELLGWVQYHQGQLEDAQRLLEDGIARARRIRHQRLLAASLIIYGLALAEAQAHPQAQAALEEALGIARASACLENHFKALCALARLGRLQKQPARALHCAREALTLPLEDPTHTHHLWAVFEAGLACLDAGDQASANTYLQQAAALLPTAHAAWIRLAEIRAACASVS